MVIMKHRILGQDSIKEAVDQLPMGLCFFDKNNRMVLCNRQMYSLALRMGDCDLQVVYDLEMMLYRPLPSVRVYEDWIYGLDDGTVWQFSKQFIISKSGQTYMEIKAIEITMLHKLKEELLRNNEVKEEMVTRLENISQYMKVSTREKEILRLKARVHSEFGEGLQRIHHYIHHDGDMEERQTILSHQRKIAKMILGEVGQGDIDDPMIEFERLMKRLNRTLVLKGTMPTKKEMRSFLVEILRECRTNMIRHARATTMYVRIFQKDGWLYMDVSNDGKVPEKEVVEGGGLSALRARIEDKGGKMTVISQPEFILVVGLPCKEEV